MPWKILITARAFNEVSDVAEDLLRDSGCELVFPPKAGPFSVDELQHWLPGMDAVLASADHYTAETLNSPAAAKLKIISRWGVGYDSINVPAATAAGIVVAYTPGLLDDAVADFTMALLLALAKRLPELNNSMRAGHWMAQWTSDFSGKTLGLIGCGRIGQSVARRASGFGVRLLGFDPKPPEAAEQLGIQFVSLDQLLAESDFVSLHAALTPDNRGLIGEEQLKKMRTSAFLINAGRGALIQEEALVRALNEGWIAGAGLDTYVVEPLAASHPLRQCRNAILTPHQASFARDTGQRVSLAAAQAILDLRDGRPPQRVVNPEVFTSGKVRAKL